MFCFLFSWILLYRNRPVLNVPVQYLSPIFLGGWLAGKAVGCLVKSGVAGWLAGGWLAVKSGVGGWVRWLVKSGVVN